MPTSWPPNSPTWTCTAPGACPPKKPPNSRCAPNALRATSTPASRTPTAPPWAPTKASSSWATPGASWVATRIRATACPWRPSRAAAPACSEITGTRPSAIRPSWPRPRPSAVTLPSAR
ncbi:hypothetical protein G6F65_021794 [Rhizopus arrhizus]|nr:hypothetical protein G6F65_021794 [Rhizopus arrhizus]